MPAGAQGPGLKGGQGIGCIKQQQGKEEGVLSVALCRGQRLTCAC